MFFKYNNIQQNINHLALKLINYQSKNYSIDFSFVNNSKNFCINIFDKKGNKLFYSECFYSDNLNSTNKKNTNKNVMLKYLNNLLFLLNLLNSDESRAFNFIKAVINDELEIYAADIFFLDRYFKR